MNINLIPAYGKDYKSKKDLIKDWNDNKDFRALNGPVVNKEQIEDLKKLGYTGISFRYKKMTENIFMKL